MIDFYYDQPAMAHDVACEMHDDIVRTNTLGYSDEFRRATFNDYSIIRNIPHRMEVMRHGDQLFLRPPRDPYDLRRRAVFVPHDARRSTIS